MWNKLKNKRYITYEHIFYMHDQLTDFKNYTIKYKRLIEKTFNTIPLTDFVYYRAIKSKSFWTLCELDNRGCPKPMLFFELASRYGSPDMLSYYCINHPRKINYHIFYKYAILGNNIDNLLWLEEYSKPNTYDFTFASHHGTIKILEWFYQRAIMVNKIKMYEEASVYNVENAKWLYKNMYS
jgi:hypothetical protein